MDLDPAVEERILALCTAAETAEPAVARDLYLEALALLPPGPWELAGMLHGVVAEASFLLGDWDGTVAAARAAIAADGVGNPLMQLRLGQAGVERGDADAIDALARAWELAGPEAFDAEEPRYREHLDAGLRAREPWPDADVLSAIEERFRASTAALMDGDATAATDRALEALALVPGAAGRVRVAVLVRLGEARWRDGELAGARQALEQAWKQGFPRTSGWPVLLLRLGQIALDTGDPAMARHWLEQAVAAGGSGVFEGEDERYLAFLLGEG
jgi:hypothetical protein